MKYTTLGVRTSPPLQPNPMTDKVIMIARRRCYVDALKFLERQRMIPAAILFCLVLNGLGIIYCRLADYADGLACFTGAENQPREHYPNLRLRMASMPISVRTYACRYRGALEISIQLLCWLKVTTMNG